MKFIGRPIPNAALLGAFATLTGIVDLEAIEKAIREKFKKDLADKNVQAANAASEFAKREQADEATVLKNEELETAKLAEEIC